MDELDIRRIILIVIVLVLLYIFYYIGNPSNTGIAGGSSGTVNPEVYAVDLPVGFFKSVYPDYDSIDQNGYMKNKDGSYLDPTKLNLPLATADQVYQAAMAKEKGISAVGAQFIGYGLLVNNNKLQLGYPRQTMIDNVGLPSANPAFNGVVPGTFMAYNSKDTPTTAILFGLKPVQGSVLKIAGIDCTIHSWFEPDQLNPTAQKIYSQNVQLN